MPDRRDVIRAAIVEFDRTSPKGQREGEFVYLLSERERADLAERIERALYPNGHEDTPELRELLRASLETAAPALA